MLSSAMSLLLAACAAVCGAQTTVDGISEALTSDVPYWILQRSFVRPGKTGKHSCVSAQIHPLGENAYRIEQKYKDGSNWTTNMLYGRLSQSDDYAVLTISQTEGGPGKSYTVSYWDSPNNCGVLTLKNDTNGITECELHAVEGSINGKRTSNCEVNYDALCKERAKDEVYSSACKTK